MNKRRGGKAKRKQIEEAAETLKEFLGKGHSWYPLYSLLVSFLAEEKMRPVVLKDPHNNIWRLYHEDRSPLLVPPPPPIESLPLACVYPPAGTVK